jgi:galacturonosyltransferase
MVLANDTSYTYNLRLEIIERLIAEGNLVNIAGKLDNFHEEFKKMGVQLININVRRHGRNPLKDIILFFNYIKILLREKPDIVLSYNIKPNIYGGMACKILRIRYIPNITGLGIAVEYPGRMQRLTIKLYKIGVSGALCIFFQNEENKQFFISHRMISSKSRIRLLPGSGVNLQLYPAMPYPDKETINFLFVARIMKEKGIDIYISAARLIWEKHKNVIFHICGGCDDEKYFSILKEAEKAGYIKYHGEQKNMLPFFEMANCVVHPSYYPEGMSNVLLEAASSARPIITTDRSGCLETVDNGKSGYIVPVKDVESLADAIERFIGLSWEQKRDMGLAGRVKMEKQFNRQIVVKAYIEEIEELK